jgi:hypothetical protein
MSTFTRARHDAEFGAAAEQRRHVPAVDDVLAGQAGDVRAPTADQAALDDRTVLAGLRQGPGQVLPGFAAAEDQAVEAPAAGHETVLPEIGRAHKRQSETTASRARAATIPSGTA